MSRSEQGRAELLGTYGQKRVATLSRCGPPNSDKTVTAEVPATDLGLQRALVRTDADVSS